MQVLLVFKVAGCAARWESWWKPGGSAEGGPVEPVPPRLRLLTQLLSSGVAQLMADVIEDFVKLLVGACLDWRNLLCESPIRAPPTPSDVPPTRRHSPAYFTP